MLKRYHQILSAVFRTVDAVVIGGAWLAAYALRFYLPAPESLAPLLNADLPSFSRYAALTPLIIFLWLATFASLQLYSSHRMLRRTHEVLMLLRGHFTSLAIFISLTYLFSEYKYSRGVVIYFGVVAAVALVCFRLVLRNLLRTVRRRGYNLRYVLAIGEGPALERVIERIHKYPELGMRFRGALVSPGSTLKNIAGVPVVGHYGEVPRVLGEVGADQVLISLPRAHAHDLDPLLRMLAREAVDIQLIPDIHEYVTLGCRIDEFDGIPMVRLNDSPLVGWGALAKRTTDLLLASIALVILSPLMALLAIGVKLSSPGPIFYAQERMGLDGRRFQMWKFRSMAVNAELESGAVWAREGDPRRTRFGTFLRSTSLDELPQFWNVVRGDMSLVGPRPERPVFVEQFRSEIAHYMLRHKVKAGITGWAQVNGWRGNTSLERRIECDLFYIRNWSYGLDWKILWLTLWKGFVNKNAY